MLLRAALLILGNFQPTRVLGLGIRSYQNHVLLATTAVASSFAFLISIKKKCFASNECLGSTLSTNLLRATKKVRNKDDESVANVDQVMKEPKPCKVSFKDMLMGSGKEEKYEDVHLSLEDDDEITFIEGDVNISLDGSYPQICFSKRVHSLIDVL
ncbi:hypothetical protein PVK06_009461 [Gossypium arboreum]|uniref:Uncharacterized protein n=1 Tax=Gossypium arboreum TaxID=29729 RepID=A0ABR0QNI2_GOSAR|nr:hypothetical protein PVK06_009461 [Gossypium arboreum]